VELIKSSKMKLAKSIKYHTNLEFVSLIVTLILFIRDYSYLHNNNTRHIHQLSTFEQLIDSIIDCNITDYVDDLLDQEMVASVSGANDKPKCPIDLDRLKYIDHAELDTWLSYHHVKYGGHFEPVGCVPKQKVGIIIPYRDKQEHLERFILFIHQFLPDQLIDYTVFVVEQTNPKTSNMMKLFNIGATKIIESHPEICCFIFHDADLIPLDQRNLYMCSRMPRHLSSSVSSYRYQLLYTRLLNGVLSMTRAQYELIGGLSDGAMDGFDAIEDTIKRIETSGLTIERTPLDYGLYIAAYHQWGKENQTLEKIQRSKYDSDSSLHTIEDYQSQGSNGDSSCIVSMTPKQLYTHVKCTI
jgi:hypothetical protein